MQDPAQPAATPRKKNRFLIVLIVAALAVLALCAAVFALIFSQVGQIATNDVPAMQKTVEDFIRAGGKQDVGAGYALFAPEAQQQFSKAQVAEMFVEAQLFDKFQSAAVTRFNIKANAATGSDSATTATLEGTIAYGDGKGTFDAELLKVGDRWMLFNIHLQIDPEKLKAWQDTHPQ